MLKVCLHGLLGNEFGETWDLKVSSVSEAVRAIEANTNKLYKFLRQKDKEGIAYKIIAGDPENKKSQILSEADLQLNISSKKEIHIIPCVSGAGDFLMGLLNVIMGLILIVVGLFFFAMGGWLLVLAGAMMLIGGVMQMLTKPPSTEEYQSQRSPYKTSTTSFAFGQVPNITNQGLPVPLGYGHAMIGTRTTSVFVRSDRYFGESSEEGTFGIQVEGLDKNNGYAPGYFTKTVSTDNPQNNPNAGKAPQGQGGYYPGEFGTFRVKDTSGTSAVEDDVQIKSFFRPGTTSFNTLQVGIKYGAKFGFSSDMVCIDEVDPGQQSIRS